MCGDSRRGKPRHVPPAHLWRARIRRLLPPGDADRRDRKNADWFASRIPRARRQSRDAEARAVGVRLDSIAAHAARLVRSRKRPGTRARAPWPGESAIGLYGLVLPAPASR